MYPPCDIGTDWSTSINPSFIPFSLISAITGRLPSTTCTMLSIFFSTSFMSIKTTPSMWCSCALTMCWVSMGKMMRGRLLRLWIPTYRKCSTLMPYCPYRMIMSWWSKCWEIWRNKWNITKPKTKSTDRRLCWLPFTKGLRAVRKGVGGFSSSPE